MFDRRVVRNINLGRCFVLVGSGASVEMGYPSWPALVHGVMKAVRESGRLQDEASYDKYIKDKRFPELLTQAERDLGSRAQLVAGIRGLLVARPGASDQVYTTLVNWPFACYLTTNWDDEIDAHLRKSRVFYKTLQNTREDFSLLRHDAAGFVVKLHSDLDHPERAVITSADYARLLTPEYKYFQDKLKSIFEMFDVLIIGHSLTDPDLSLILQFAKDTASPEHPVFLMAADLTRAEEREFFERFNIVAIRYDNPDGGHSQLRRQLALMSKFIIPRKQRLDAGIATYSAEELEAAQAVAIYRRFVAAERDELQPVAYLGPLLLQALVGSSTPVPEGEMLDLPPLSSAAATQAVRELLPGVLDQLTQDGLAERSEKGVSLSGKGKAQAKELMERRSVEEEQAYGQFVAELEGRFGSLDDTERRQAADLLKDTLVKVFKQRGLSIANAVFAGRSLDRDALSDVFESLSSVATKISDRQRALSFMESAQSFLLQPTEAQKQYLASLSQGFFLYHLFGLDPNCAKVRRDVLRETLWWCDASVLLPLLAVGSINNQYAEDLFKDLRELNANTLTTTRLLREIMEHLEWASRLLQRESLQSATVLSAATEYGGYKQNLFIDGFIRLSAQGEVSRVDEYFGTVAPYGATEAGIRRVLEQRGIRIINISELGGYDAAEDGRAMFELSYDIAEARTRAATLRSALQVEAEAEILQVIRGLQSGRYTPPIDGLIPERSFFLSQSRVLDRIAPAEPVSWTPEALYRYIKALPGEKLDPDLLQRCMLQEYFASGEVLLDTPSYERFFGPSINAATTTYQAERDKYLKAFPEKTTRALDGAFESTPDLQKPFFVQQMGWKVAREEEKKAIAAQQRAVVAKAEAEAAVAELQKIQQERDKDWRRRKRARALQLEAEERNARDPKHRQKRDRQAKNRSRKRKH